MIDRRTPLALIVVVATSGVLAGWLLGVNPFSEPELYATGAEPLDLAVADLDADGHLDVVTANREGRSLSIFRGAGDGSLIAVEPIDTGVGATSVALADVDVDGILDAVVSACEPGCARSSVLIYRGLGDGRFESWRNIPVDGVPYNVTVAELNGDGRPDIAATDYPAGQLRVWLSDDTESGFAELALPTGAKPIALVAEDLDSDGSVDLVTSDHGSGSSTVYLSYGNGELSDPIEVPTGELPYAIAAGSLDGDGIADLVVVQSTDPGRLLVLQGRGDGTFAFRQDFPVEGIPIFVAIADVDGDGASDLVITRQAGEYAGVFRNDGDGLFDELEIHVPAQNRIYSFAVTDLDGDALPELITVDFESSSVAVARGRRPPS